MAETNKNNGTSSTWNSSSTCVAEGIPFIKPTQYLEILGASGAEILGTIVVMRLIDTGRPRTLLICWGVATLSFLSCALSRIPGLPWNHTVFNVIQVLLIILIRGSTVGAYTVAYTFVNEIYPANIRSSAIGVLVAFSYVGAAGSVCCDD